MFAEANDKPRWGDKRPAYAVYLDAVFALFPDAQFINLVRDPRAAVESQMRVPWYAAQGASALGPALATWEFAINRVDRFASRLRPDQLLDLRYEDLVRDPRAALARICEFGGLRGGDAIDEMLEGSRGGLARGWHERVAEPINPALIEGWRERLQAHHLAVVEHATQRHFQRLGYLPTGPADVSAARSELRQLARARRLRVVKWARYAVGEQKRRRLTHRHPVGTQRV
jgi:hypothetical protein